MPCYHPMVAVITGYSKFDGRPMYKMKGDLVGDLQKPDRLLPCGQCIGCRLDKSRQWADRMMIELDHSKKGIFCTFTFDDDHLDDEFHKAMLNDDGTWNYTLYKRDFQLFMKRLREHFQGKEIRFYAAGEYGDRTLRPHYHAILFGLDVCDFDDRVEKGSNEFHQKYYSSQLLDDLWKNGFTSLSDVSWSTCAYVSRYVTKKLTGQEALSYVIRNVEPEFSLMSRRPGLGGYYLLDHRSNVGQKIKIDTSSDVKYDLKGKVKKKRNNIPVPRYLMDKLKEEMPGYYDRIRFEREKYANDKLFGELLNTDLECSDYLRVKEKSKKEDITVLKRNKI